MRKKRDLAKIYVPIFFLNATLLRTFVTFIEKRKMRVGRQTESERKPKPK